MRRRAFITLIGGAAAWPLAVRAQQPAMPVIGFLGSSAPVDRTRFLTAFRQGLREPGYVEGQNVTIEYRWGEGRDERFAEIAAEFVRLKVDLIVASTTTPAIAAKQATSTIPIVFVGGGRPGWHRSRPKPGASRRQRHRPGTPITRH